jgi:hypothetical protein
MSFGKMHLTASNIEANKSSRLSGHNHEWDKRILALLGKKVHRNRVTELLSEAKKTGVPIKSWSLPVQWDIPLKELAVSCDIIYATLEGDVVMKESTDDGIPFNEFAVGAILNKLKSPNFIQTLGMVNLDSNTLLLSRSHGATFEDAIKTMTLKQLCNVVLQVPCACRKAYEEFSFCHYDLREGNVLIETRDEDVVLDYGDISIKTNVVAVIHDFGTSYAEYCGYSIGSSQDIPYFCVYGDRPHPAGDMYTFFQTLFCEVSKSFSTIHQAQEKKNIVAKCLEYFTDEDPNYHTKKVKNGRIPLMKSTKDFDFNDFIRYLKQNEIHIYDS